MQRNLSIVLLGLLAGSAGGALVLAFGRSSHAAPDADAVGLPKSNSDVAAALEAIRALDRRMARIEAGLATRESGATRAPVNSAAAPADAAEPNATPSKELAALRTDVVRISERLAVTEEGLKDSGLRWARNPTVEQLQRARKDVNWALVDELHDAIRQAVPENRSHALERVSAMTIEDVLEQIGAPTRTGQGAWYYVRAVAAARTPDLGIRLDFSGERVVGWSAVGLR